jgi:hypothetical protein
VMWGTSVPAPQPRSELRRAMAQCLRESQLATKQRSRQKQSVPQHKLRERQTNDRGNRRKKHRLALCDRTPPG